MFRDSYQHGMLTVFFSGGSNPLSIWDTITNNGYIKRFLDPEIRTMVLEIRGSNVSTSYMICPKGDQVLGITMPFLVMVCKNLTKYFSFEVTILDDTGVRRRFRVSNFQSTTQILPLCTVMPICLSPGWNQVQFNLAEFTKRAYKKQFVEVQKLKINANIRLRRIYFTEKLLAEEDLPPEYKLYFPLTQKGSKSKIVGGKSTPSPESITSGPKVKSKLPVPDLNEVALEKKVTNGALEEVIPTASKEQVNGGEEEEELKKQVSSKAMVKSSKENIENEDQINMILSSNALEKEKSTTVGETEDQENESQPKTTEEQEGGEYVDNNKKVDSANVNVQEDNQINPDENNVENNTDNAVDAS